MNAGVGAVTALLVLASLVSIAAARDAAMRGSPTARLCGAARVGATRRARLPGAPRSFDSYLRAIGVDWPADRLWSAWLVATAVLCASALVAGGPGLAFVAVVVSIAAPGSAARALRGRGAARLEASLPVALEAVARSLRSGASLRQAVDESAQATPGTLGADLARVAAESERGVPVADALEAWSERRQLPGVRLAVAALGLGAETGGAQARAIDGVAATLRQRLAVAAEARALATQARASAAVIALAPLVFCALASVADPRLGEFLLRTPLGLLILVGGLGLDAVGALWMAHLTRVDS